MLTAGRPTGQKAAMGCYLFYHPCSTAPIGVLSVKVLGRRESSLGMRHVVSWMGWVVILLPPQFFVLFSTSSALFGLKHADSSTMQGMVSDSGTLVTGSFPQPVAGGAVADLGDGAWGRCGPSK